MKLCFISQCIPHRMVTVLLSSQNIKSGSLYMPVFAGTNPYIGPCGWNSQFSNTFNFTLFFQGFIVIDINKVLSFFLSADTRCFVIYIRQVSNFCGLVVILVDL